MLQNPHQHRRGGRWRARLRRPWAAEARQLDTWKAQRRDKTRPTRTAPGHCDTKLALHTPSHRMSGTKLALHTPSHRMSGTKLALLTPSHRMCGIKLALLAQNGPNWHVFRAQGELYTAYKAKTGLAITAHQAPLLRRAPEGPEGQATKPVGGGGA